MPSFPYEVPRNVERAAKKMLKEKRSNGEYRYTPEDVCEHVRVRRPTTCP